MVKIVNILFVHDPDSLVCETALKVSGVSVSAEGRSGYSVLTPSHRKSYMKSFTTKM